MTEPRKPTLVNVGAVAGPALASLLAGCSLITGWSGYHNAGDVDGGPLDGAVDGGGRDGGVELCDPACGDSGECVDGVCRCGGGAACASDRACCDGECVDTASDLEHCGGCGTVCPGGPRGIQLCEASSCALRCEDGFEDCDDAAPGCEADLSSPATCGGCGVACTGGQLCGLDADGARACVDSCGAGETECSGSCVDTSSSLSHCGACDAPCASPTNTTAACGSGTCNYTCVGEFVDCDMDLGAPASSNGCEVVPPNRYADMDMDGYGLSTSPMRFCEGVPSPGYASLPGECDDEDPSVNPGSLERCGGADEDCDMAFDEGFMLGDPCTCSAGADPGALVCSSDGATSECGYPAERCGNGADDDCDGRIDQGCGVDADGDGYSPPSDCDDSDPAVNPGAADSCDGVDNDCDGFADDDLVILPAHTVGTFSTTGGSIFPYEPNVTWVPSRSSGAVVWGNQRGATSYEMRFSTIDGDGLAVTSDRAVASFGEAPEDINVAWDGSAWAVVFRTPGSSAWMVRVREDGTVATPLGRLPGTAAGDRVGQLAVAQGDSELAVAYGFYGPSSWEMRGVVLRDGSVAGATQTIFTYASSTTAVWRPAIAHVGGGEYGVVFSDYSMAYQRFRSTGLVGSSVRFAHPGGHQEYAGDASYEPASDRLAFTYYDLSTSSGPAYLDLLDVASGSLASAHLAVGGYLVRVNAAEDGSVLTLPFGAASGVRVRASDGAVYPTPTPVPTYGWPNMDGLQGTGHRFIGIFARGGSGVVETEVMTCR